MKYHRGRPNGNGQRNSLSPRPFDGNVCDCGRLLPADYKIIGGLTKRVVDSVCAACSIEEKEKNKSMNDTIIYTRVEIDALQQNAFDMGFALGRKMGAQDARFLEHRAEVRRVLENTEMRADMQRYSERQG